MFLLKYPRLVVLLFASLFAGLITFIVCRVIRSDSMHIAIYVSSAMISGGFWAPIITTRIVDKEQSCGHIRAALLGFASALLSILTVHIPIDWEIRLINMANGMASLPQTLKYMFIDDMANNIGGGLFALLFFGWYLAPMGGVAGMLMVELFRPRTPEVPE